MSKQQYSIWHKYEQEFCLRRAWRYGSLKIKDLVDAFEMTTRSASRRFEKVAPCSGRGNIEILTKAQLRITCPKSNELYLIRNGKNQNGKTIIPNPRVIIPPECTSEADFLRKINIYNVSHYSHLSSDLSKMDVEKEMAQLFFIMTGLRPGEINIDHYSLINNFPYQPGGLLRLLKTITGKPKKQLDITYVSLNKNDNGKKIRIIPLSIQVIGEQISVYACKSAYFKNGQWVPCEEMRTYVLSRIIEYSSIKMVHPKDLARLRLPAANESKTQEHFSTNPEYTDIQKQIISSELKLKNGNLILPESKMFQFMRAYSDLPPNGIWPPLIHPNKGQKK